MKVTLFDTEFERSAPLEAAEWQPYDWMEGNWACDCNRRIAFGLDIDAHNTCIGFQRFIVIDSDHPEFHSHSWNKGYPLGLITLAKRFAKVQDDIDAMGKTIHLLQDQVTRNHKISLEWKQRYEAAWSNRDRFCGAINEIAGIIGMKVENASEQAVVRNVKHLVRDYMTLPGCKRTAEMLPDIKEIHELYDHK